MSSTSSSTSTSSNPLIPSVVSYGLETGLDTSSIIQAELQPYQQQITDLQNQQTSLGTNVSDYQKINSDLATLNTDAGLLSTSSGWAARAATVSNSAVATATAADGTPTGSIQFSVLQLAASNSIVSSGTASSTSQIVSAAPDFLLSQGGATLGLSSLGATSGLSLGSHNVAVTQASSAASTSGTTVLGSAASGIAITAGSNDTVNVDVDGNSYSLVLAASPSGGYSGSGLLTAVQSAITAAGASGVLQAGYDSAGHLMLSTTAQGSSQSLSVTGGDALSTLGLSTTGTLSGTDGIVTVDGTANTFSDITAGSTVTLNGPGGAAMTAQIATPSATGGSMLSLGSLSATNISTGSGSLADLVANINAAGTGITASAVQSGTNQYVLQLASSATGASNDLSVDMGAFSSSSLGALQVASAGQDAQIQVGGAGGYTVSSANDTFTGLLPGLSISVQQTTSSPVTVSVNNDVSTIAGSVQNLVNDANAVLSDIQTYAGYNQSTKSGGPLMGQAPLQNLTNQILALFASASGTSTLGNSVAAGIKISNGQLTFDQTAFETAYQANPTQMQAMFTRGGSFSASSPSYAGEVSLDYASTSTKAGSYAVVVNQSATQAQATGAALAGGTVGAGETLTIGAGGSSVQYTTTAGESLQAVAQGLNASFAGSSMGLSAQIVQGNQLQIESVGYGSHYGFTVSTTNTAAGTLGLTGGTASASYSGLDVEGTINGVAATGSGQFLSAPASDPSLAGLTLQVTATGISSPTSLGNFTYSPGLAQSLSNLSDAASNPATGTITQTITSIQNQAQNLNPQIQFYTNIMDAEQKVLLNRYANLESTVGTLKNQSSTLAQELSGLSSSGI